MKTFADYLGKRILGQIATSLKHYDSPWEYTILELTPDKKYVKYIDNINQRTSWAEAEMTKFLYELPS